MADEAAEINTAPEDGEAKQTEHEVLEVSPENKDPVDEQVQNDEPVTESTWTAPIFSLARKATETISSGVSYSAALRNSTSLSSLSPATDKPPENDSSRAKMLTGLLFTTTLFVYSQSLQL